MFRRWLPGLLTATAALACWLGAAAPVQAQVQAQAQIQAQAQVQLQLQPPPYTYAYAYDAARFPLYRPYCVNRFWNYPYYYYPADYWPCQGCKWPEPPGKPYMRPPAYMAYPPFLEPNWRYSYFEPHTYHRGFHFMLDIF